ncbi:LamG-like jellyroll fold domain-containing protein [Spirosoma litoris]
MKTRQISAWVMAGLVMSAAFTSCKKSDDVATLPPIGGYNTSNDVAATNLLAHWSFEGTTNEDISKTAATTAKNNTFGTGGPKGQSLSLASGFLVYPTINALSSANAISSVTVSAWINVANNGKTGSSVFALTQAQATQADWNQGPINMYVETGAPLTKSDTLALHAAFHTYSGGNYSLGGDNINDYGVRGTDFQTVKGGGKWIHYVMVYDGSGSNIDIYANGQLVSNKNFRNRTTGTPPVGIGPITLATPTQVLIGGWPNVDTGYPKSANQAFQGLFVGSIDEIRVYNKALSGTDIGSLYQLESAGR